MKRSLTVAAKRLCLSLVVAALVVHRSAADEQPPPTPSVSYTRDALPILQARCHGCHQPAKASGGYVMTSADGLRRGGESAEPAVVPGQPDASRLLRQITPVDGKAAMPPEGPPLREAEIDLLRRWIAAGAVDDSPAQSGPSFDAAHPPVYRQLPVVTSIDFSPDGGLIAVAGFHETLLYEAPPLDLPAAEGSPNGDQAGVVASSHPVARLIGLSPRIESISFSPDGKRLAITGGTPARMGEVQIWNVATRELELSVPMTFDSVYGVSWSPDGKALAFGCTDKAVRAIDSATGAQILYQGAHNDWVLDTVFSADGTHLASVGRDATAKLIEKPTQRFVDNITSITPGALRGGINAVARHPQRDEIVFGGADGTPKIYRMHRTTKREIGDDANLLCVLPAMPGRVFDVDWSVDGRVIVAGSSLDGKGTVYAYRIDPAFEPPKEIHDLLVKPTHQRNAAEIAKLEEYFKATVATTSATTIETGGVYAVAVRHDGRLIAAAGGDGYLRLLDPESGKVVRQFAAAPIETGPTEAPPTETPPIATAPRENAADSASEVAAAAGEGSQKVNFIQDVAPILSRSGCNAGTCHGAQDGKNGFKLSLRGYDPLFDVRALADDLASRRINLAAPDQSLMLLKPTARVPHAGGQALRPDSDYYRIVKAWIESGAPLDQNVPRVQGIAVEPVNPILQTIGERQQMRVVATYTDGSTRDVTREAFVESGNSEVVRTVDNSPGMMEVLRRGEAPVLVRYEGAYAATTITAIGDRSGFAWEEPPANNPIDQFVHAKLARTKTSSGPLCDDYAFVRRVTLDLTGLPPTPDEIEAFVSDRRDSRWKRDRLIDRLIGSPAFVEHWTNKWADLLQVNGKFLGRSGASAFREWIRQQTAANVPYDAFARAIITAKGSNKDQPAASYFKILRDPEPTMENTTHLFLATRFNCNKCHDHPFERWTQDQYYELAAYFAQVGLERDPASGDQSIAGTDVEAARPVYEVVLDRAEGEVVHKRTGQQAPPAFPFASAHKCGDDATRREQLAAWITSPENPYFAMSYVNRLWAYLTGRGVIDPIDDIRAGNPASDPELLAWLTQEFIDSGFDRQHILRTICRSRTYQLAIDSDQYNADDVVNYSHARPRRLPAEVLYDAIHLVTGAPSAFPDLPPGTRAASLPDVGIQLPDGFLNSLGRPARESACECERTNELQMGPIMALVNGPTVSQAINHPQGALNGMVNEIADDAELVRKLFFRILSRPASDGEVAEAVDVFHSLDQEHKKLIDDAAKTEAELAPIEAQREQQRLERLAATERELQEHIAAIAPERNLLEQRRQQSIAQAEQELAAHKGALLQKLPDWIQERKKDPAWIPLDVRQLASAQGAQLVVEKDRSLRADGPLNRKETYTLTAPVDLAKIAAIRIEALNGETLPQKGPGRNDDGNFVLTELSAEYAQLPAVESLLACWEFSAGPDDGRPQSGEDEWHPVDATQATQDEGRLLLSHPERKAQLALERTLPAGPMALQITARLNAQATLRLRWKSIAAPAGAEPSDDPRGAVEEPAPLGDGPWRTYRLYFRPETDVASLYLEIEGGGDGPVAIDSMQLLQGTPPEFRALALQNALADFSQPGYPVASAIDGSLAENDNGWGVSPQAGQRHWATFEVKPNEALQGRGLLRVKLIQNFFSGKHALGRFRVSTVYAPHPVGLALPQDLTDLIALEENQRTAEQQAALREHYVQHDAAHIEAQARLEGAKVPVPPDARQQQLEQRVTLLKAPLPIDSRLVRMRRAVELSQSQLQSRRLVAAQDVAWALINSPEFLYNH